VFSDIVKRRSSRAIAKQPVQLELVGSAIRATLQAYRGKNLSSESLNDRRRVHALVGLPHGLAIGSILKQTGFSNDRAYESNPFVRATA
jgi:hypothetical protein